MRKKITLLFIFSALFIFNYGCKNEDDVKELSKNGAVETDISVNHLDSANDVIQTTYNVWVKNAIAKKIIHVDTVPSLGITTEEGENSDGDTRPVTLQKDYEVFITVK